MIAETDQTGWERECGPGKAGEPSEKAEAIQIAEGNW